LPLFVVGREAAVALHANLTKIAPGTWDQGNNNVLGLMDEGCKLFYAHPTKADPFH